MIPAEGRILTDAKAFEAVIVSRFHDRCAVRACIPEADRKVSGRSGKIAGTGSTRLRVSIWVSRQGTRPAVTSQGCGVFENRPVKEPPDRTRLAGSVRVEQDFGDIGDVLGSQFFETFDLRL
jgi:hypothetical protein